MILLIISSQMVWLGLWMFFFYTYFLSSSLLSNKCQKYHIKIGCGGDNKIHRIISNFMYGNTVRLPLSIGPICALANIQRFASYFTLLLLLQRRCTTYEEDVFDCINWCIVSLGGGGVGSTIFGQQSFDFASGMVDSWVMGFCVEKAWDRYEDQRSSGEWR